MTISLRALIIVALALFTLLVLLLGQWERNPQGCANSPQVDPPLSAEFHNVTKIAGRHVEQGRFPKAIEMLEDYRADPVTPLIDRISIDFGLAQIYGIWGDFDQSVIYAQRAVEETRCRVTPALQAAAEVMLGGLYVELARRHDGEEAQNYYRLGLKNLVPALESGPLATAQNFDAVANVYMVLDPPEQEKAAEWLEKGVAASSDLTDLVTENRHRQWVQLLMALDNLDRVVTPARQLAQKFDNQQDWYQLAYIIWTLGRADDEIARMIAVLDAEDPPTANQYAYLVRLKMLTNNADAALMTMQDGVARNIVSQVQYDEFKKRYDTVSGTDGTSDGSKGAYPTYRVHPQFPRMAQEQGISGCVIYGFTISADGRTTDIFPLESSNPLFESYGERAIEQFRYFPSTVNGIAVASPEQTIRLVWELEGESLPDHEACQGDEDFDPDDNPDGNSMEPHGPVLPKGSG